MALQKVQMNLDEQLIKQVDEYAATLHVNRTAAVSVLLSRALQADKLAADLSDLMDAYRVQSGKIPVSIDEVGRRSIGEGPPENGSGATHDARRRRCSSRRLTR